MLDHLFKDIDQHDFFDMTNFGKPYKMKDFNQSSEGGFH